MHSLKVLEASKAADEKKHEQLTNQLNLLEQNSREYKESSALSLLNHQNLSNSILQIKNERDNTMTDLEEMKIKVNSLNCNLINLECDKECLTSKVNAGQKETQALHLQVSKLKAEILHLKGENLKLTANCEKGNLQLSTLIASRSVTPPASAPVPSLILVPPTVVSVVESARGGDYRIGGKDYEELTNLKKENKTLKQRVRLLR